LWKISKFMDMWEEMKKGVDPCDTQKKWEEATKTKEYKDAIEACGIPNYIG
jgi:hypothetical protein